MNNVSNKSIFFLIIVISLKSQNAKKKYKKKNYQNEKNIVNVDNNEENVNEKIILQNDKYDNNIDLDEVDQTR